MLFNPAYALFENNRLVPVLFIEDSIKERQRILVAMCSIVFLTHGGLQDVMTILTNLPHVNHPARLAFLHRIHEPQLPLHHSAPSDPQDRASSSSPDYSPDPEDLIFFCHINIIHSSTTSILAHEHAIDF